MDHRSVDRVLTPELVSSLVAEQFPEFGGSQVRSFGAGCDNEVFTVDDKWVFRFPKRADCVPWVRREIEIMPVVASALGLKVSAFDYIGDPRSAFPYPFVGYRMLPGVGADRGPTTDRGALAADLGRLLGRLHRIEPASIPPPPAAREPEPWTAIRVDRVAVADIVRPLLDRDLRARADPYLTGAATPPPSSGVRRFVHNDICPDHLLVDPGTGKLTGIIDWSEAMIGDPVPDFVGLIGIAGYSFIGDVLAHYPLPLDATFSARLTWLTRSLTLTWLAETATADPDDVPKHLTWVARAFGH